MKHTFILFYLFVVTAPSSFGQHARIRGNVKLPAEWRRTVYVCRIPDFGLMYQASDALLVANGEIDEDGNFDVQLPFTERGHNAGKSETLYRLQFVRSEDPVSTIIIGSNDENHVFFIAKKSDSITFTRTAIPSPDERLVEQSRVRGGVSNEELNALLGLIKQDTIRRDSLKRRLIVVARDATSDPVRLLAVNAMFGLSDAQKSEVRVILSNHDRSNPYGTRIFEEYKQSQAWRYALVLLLIAVIVVVPLGIRYYRSLMIRRSLSLLSPRELHIARLIVEGKSNKDVAVSLNIELSTVKTHVNNIYAKLKVNERKGLTRFEQGLRSSLRSE